MNKTIDEIKKELDGLHDGADFSDIGNAIGLVIGTYQNEKPGFDADIFIDGFEHGLSIANGTHG